MMTTGIRAVLFDFGGVLAEEGFRQGLMAMASEQGLDVEGMPVAGLKAVYDSGFVLGRGTEAGFWALMRTRTGLRGEDHALTQNILQRFVIHPWMIERVRLLRARGYVTGILSDQTHWLDALNEKYHFSEVFDHIFNSYYLGKGKQDPTLFSDVAAALEMPPAAILFIDDDAGNVVRAHNAGLQAIQYLDRESFIAELERALSRDNQQQNRDT